MTIPVIDRNEIKRKASFLIEYGYLESEDENSINYVLEKISISAIYSPNSEESDVSIRFQESNQAFSIGWIALVTNNIKGNVDKLENVKDLLKYIKENYQKIINLQFCLESNKLIDEYVKKHHERFDKAVLDFLDM